MPSTGDASNYRSFEYLLLVSSLLHASAVSMPTCAPHHLDATLDLLRYMVGLACRRETFTSHKGDGMLAKPVSIFTPVSIPMPVFIPTPISMPVPILRRSAEDERQKYDNKG